MNQRIILLSALLTMLPLLTACPYESAVPLGKPGDAKIDENLPGKWRPLEKKEDSGTLTISRFNDHELLIVIQEEGKEKIDRLRAFVTEIGGVKFLNIQEIKGQYEKRKWMFVKYSIRGEDLSFQTVEDDIFKRRFSKPEDLFNFIKKNLKNKGLFDEDDIDILKRIND